LNSLILLAASLSVGSRWAVCAAIHRVYRQQENRFVVNGDPTVSRTNKVNVRTDSLVTPRMPREPEADQIGRKRWSIPLSYTPAFAPVAVGDWPVRFASPWLRSSAGPSATRAHWGGRA